MSIHPGFSPPKLHQVYSTNDQIADLQEQGPEEIGRGAQAANSSYECDPHGFLQAFPTLNPHQIQALATAGRLLTSSVLLYDRVTERPASAEIGTLTALQTLQFEAYHSLHQIFPAQAAFWARLRGYLAEYADACLLEQQFAHGAQEWSTCDEATCLRIAIGKHGLARTMLAGMAELAHDDQPLEPLLKALNCYHIARQMLDDLTNWKADLRAAQPSLLLTRVLQERPAWQTPEAATRSRKSFAQRMYYEQHASYIIQLALESLDRVDGYLAGVPTLEWHRVVEQLRHSLQDLLHDIYRIIQHNLRRVTRQPKLSLSLPSAVNPWQQSMWNGVQFLLYQWRHGFGEARDISLFPRDQGFKATHDHRYGDIFQRAVIADTLADVNRLLGGQLDPVIDYEADYLISKRDRSPLGGWRYYFELPEIPPDSNDLAQVIQVLLRSSQRPMIAAYCEPILELLLRDNAHADGSFETWIVPASERTLEQERQATYIERTWGCGPDCAVMANLLYALDCYDPSRFEQLIQRGIGYLVSQQQANGSWLSTWAVGPYYGTYSVLRLLARCCPASPALARAHQFLRATQHQDGGWGMQATSDSLNTALATLGLISSYQPKAHQHLLHGIIYLTEQQHADDGWERCQLIQLGGGQSTGPQQSPICYGSRTMTTSFVVKAFVAWLQHHEN